MQASQHRFGCRQARVGLFPICLHLLAASIQGCIGSAQIIPWTTKPPIFGSSRDHGRGIYFVFASRLLPQVADSSSNGNIGARLYARVAHCDDIK